MFYGCFIGEDDIERSVLSNILLLCTQLTFDLILSYRDIFRLGIYHYRFYCTYWNTFSMIVSFYPILPPEVFLVEWPANKKGFSWFCIEMIILDIQILKKKNSQEEEFESAQHSSTPDLWHHMRK